MTTLLMSLSLALGILVSDLSGYRLLTRVHAQEGTCGGSVIIQDGLILSGITVRNIVVNGSVLEQAVIAGSVQLIDATVEGPPIGIEADGVIIGSGDSPVSNGVIIGSGDRPCSNGVIIGSGDRPVPNGVIIGSGDRPVPNGVIIGSGDRPAPNGVIIGSGNATIYGMTGETTGTAVGGTLTGDNITITDGLITGQNLLLSGTTINQGSISGTITSVTITPAN
jgi:hypothetical protein